MTATITETLPEIAARLGFTLSVDAGPAAKSEKHGDGGEWEHLAYTVTLSRNGRKVKTLEYKLGAGHVKRETLEALRRSTDQGLDTLTLNTMIRQPHARHANMTYYRTILEAAAKRGKVAPTVADVLHSMLLDGAAHLDSLTFEEWAGEFGYDTDSRRALAMFEACCDEGRAIARACNPEEIAALRDAASNF